VVASTGLEIPGLSVPFGLYDMFNTGGTEKHLEFFIEENYGAKTGNFSEFGFLFVCLFGVTGVAKLSWGERLIANNILYNSTRLFFWWFQYVVGALDQRSEGYVI
jgi:hypothetical protein